MVTIFSALAEGTGVLKENNIDTPRLDSEIILAHILKCSRLKLVTERNLCLSDEQYLRFKELISLRVKGMPVAYLTGTKEFMGLCFAVDRGVLIPRGDTEIAVEKVIDECNRIEGTASVVDVGCGSGAIGISAARYAENAAVTLVDISQKAMEIAELNIRMNSLSDRVRVIKGDLLTPVMNEAFDIIVSNPPYIETDVIRTLQREVRDYEPMIALDGGYDGLEFYRKIAYQAAGCLKHGGLIIFEIGYNQALSVTNILLENNFKDIHIFKDLAGLDRCVTARI